VVADLVQELAGIPGGKRGAAAELRAGLATGETIERLRQRSAGEGPA